MNAIPQDRHLSPLGRQGLAIYEAQLKEILEPDHNGAAVAIHVDTGDYSIGKSHSAATRELLARHDRDGRIVTLSIGPPSDSDMRLIARMNAGSKR